MPHCLRFDRQATALACFFTRCNAGINIAINSAIMAITTKSSINVNPFLRIVSRIPDSRFSILVEYRVGLFQPRTNCPPGDTSLPAAGSRPPGAIGARLLILLCVVATLRSTSCYHRLLRPQLLVKPLTCAWAPVLASPRVQVTAGTGKGKTAGRFQQRPNSSGPIQPNIIKVHRS